MRQKRAKIYKKLMALYSMSFGFRQPYQVLIDSSFCVHSSQNKIDVEKQLDTILQGQTKPMITQCCMVELYKLGTTSQSIVDMAKRFERRKCNHKEAIEGDACMKSVVGETNKHRYVVATQSQPLREALRLIPSVPIVHINRVVMVIEPPSDATLRAKALAETTAQTPRAPELAKIAAQQPQASEPPPKKRKGAKEPNPLSIKKKKPKGFESGPSSGVASSSKGRGHVTLGLNQTLAPSKGVKRRREDEATSEAQQQATPSHIPVAVVSSKTTRASSPTVTPDIRESGRDDEQRGIINGDSSRGHRKKRRRKGASTVPVGVQE